MEVCLLHVDIEELAYKSVMFSSDTLALWHLLMGAALEVVDSFG